MGRLIQWLDLKCPRYLSHVLSYYLIPLRNYQRPGRSVFVLYVWWTCILKTVIFIPILIFTKHSPIRNFKIWMTLKHLFFLGDYGIHWKICSTLKHVPSSIIPFFADNELNIICLSTVCLILPRISWMISLYIM